MPQRCGRDYTKETDISSSIRLRGVIMARNRKGHTYCDVTTIRQTRHFRSWRRQISRWRRRWYRQTGRGPLSFVFLLLSMSAFALAYFSMRYTYMTTAILWYNGLCAIRVLFMYDACQCTWRIATIKFNKVTLCPLIVIPNISDLLRPRVLNPGSRLASWMR